MELIYQREGGGGWAWGVQLYFCTLILSTFLQNPGRLAQKCTVLKMYENLEISRTCVLNANYAISSYLIIVQEDFSKIYFSSEDFSQISG